jgi:diguanylate cyclase (GGDEF)-like protein
VKKRGNETKLFSLLSALGMVALISFFDYHTEPELSLLLFYLIPIFQATWFIGGRAGVSISFISALAWVLVRYSAASGDNGSLTLYWNASIQLGIFLIVTYVTYIQLRLRRALRHEQELARTDFLTGALNRRAFAEILTAEVERATRYKHAFSVAFIDLDNFKSVNDTHGHAAGDSLLRTIVLTVGDNIRSTDTIARLGGDEFVILFPETGAEAADRITNKVHEKLAGAMRERDWPVTSSIGLVTYMGNPPSPDAILNKAEQLMYVAKNGGKNKIERTVITDKH